MLPARAFALGRGLRASGVAIAAWIALVACDSAQPPEVVEQVGQADAAAALPRTPAPEGARVYIISPTDGATVTSPVPVRFGLSAMGVAPAGVQNPKAGHHHLIIDAPTPPAQLPVPADARHRHFGGGQTEAEIELEPGKHTLQLLLGDHLHIPHDPPIVSEVITIHVE